MSSGITQDVFELVLAAGVRVGGGEHESLIHVWWRAPDQGERLVQVYVDGRLVEVTGDVDQREVWLVGDRGRAHRVDLLAVPVGGVEAIHAEHAGVLGDWEPGLVRDVCVGLIRDERLAVDTRLRVSVDGEGEDAGAMWGPLDHRGGFGALFGEGGFGIDAATGPGLGVGELGMGPLGVDGEAWRWRRGDLEAGDYEVVVGAVDREGQRAGVDAGPIAVSVEALPRAGAGLSMDADFTLRWG